MLKTDHTAVAQETVGPVVMRAGETFLIFRCGGNGEVAPGGPKGEVS